MTASAQTSPACTIIQSVAELRGLRDALACVADVPGAASGIVQHPDWLLFELAWRGEIFSPHIIVVRSADGLVIGYAPLLAYVHHARLALGNYQLPIYRGRALRLLGAGVVAGPSQRAVVERMTSEVLRQARKTKVVRIQEADLPNAFALALAYGSRKFTPVQSNLLDQVNWSIDSQPSREAWLASLGSKKRNDLTRRQRNVYKKLGEEAHWRTFDRPEDIDDYCALMNQVYARSWHAKELPTDWELPERKALFRQLASDRRVVGHMLLLGSRPIAYVHGYRFDRRYLMDDTGYDDEFASLGVGATLVFQTVCDLLERYPGEVIDFGYGDNQYKRVLANRQTPCGSLYLVRGASPLARFGVIAPLRGLYRWMRRLSRNEQTVSAV
ncbi:GNAT family N-acetyltransferase [Dyella sp. 20L07]|uniref:GNAT family N-acetyltransferase n=1 Tax=Dyella sp. 20L07 TaxID=3384240 RepID=UPI003D2AF3DD